MRNNRRIGANEKVLLLILGIIILGIIVLGNFSPKNGVQGGVVFEEQDPGAVEETPTSGQRLEPDAGLGDLCPDEGRCISFCQNNPGQCQEYCAGNQEKVLCKKYVGIMPAQEIGTGIAGEMGEMIQGLMEKMAGDSAPSSSSMPREEMNEMIREMMGQMMGDASPIPRQAEFVCNRTPHQKTVATTPYYTGHLIDSHLHLPSLMRMPSDVAKQADWDPPVLDQDVSKAEIICLFDKENIISGFGFYVVPNMMKGFAAQPIKQFEQQYPGRIIPFLMPVPVSGLELTPKEAEDLLYSNKGLWKGYGELALYKGSLKGVSPDDPSLREIYQLADKHNLIVMIHPDKGQQQAIEQVLRDYPGVTFLFHGNVEIGPYATEIIAQYQNAYFTIDADLWDLPSDRQSVNLYDAATKEEFISDFKRDYSRVQRAAIARWKNAIETYPDKFLWGSDRANAMHFDAEVGALIEESARSFIGQLDPSVQEKFAYKNAERMIRDRS